MKQKEKMMAITNYITSEFPQGCNNMPCTGCPLQSQEGNTIEDTIEDSICDMMLRIARIAERSAADIEIANEVVNEYKWEEDKYEIVEDKYEVTT